MNKQQREARETLFAYKVRHALDRHLDTLPASTSQRLATARQLALARKKQPATVAQFQHLPRLSGAAGSTFSSARQGHGSPRSAWFTRLGVALPILLGIVLFVGLYQSEERNRIDELADIDSAILSEELPLTAYLDHGFRAYLAKQDQ